MWENGDSAAHTVVSGTPGEGSDGVFSSGLIISGSTFTFTFTESGTYPYICIVHPWLTGTVTVADHQKPNVVALPPLPHAEPGMIAVTDAGPPPYSGNGRVQVFHPNGTLAFSIERQWADSMAIGPDGRTVMGHSDTAHVSVFHPNGTLAFSIGSRGEVPGEFDSPRGVAVGPDGRIVVADAGSHRVQVFHPNGTLAFPFGSLGNGSGQFDSPRGVAVGPDGRIVVADTENNRVQVFHPNGTLALSLNSSQPGHGLFISPRGVAVGPDGRIVVADQSRVTTFHPNGTLGPSFWPTLGYVHSSGPLHSVAVGADGRIVVTVPGSNRVQVFYPNGTLVLSIWTDDVWHSGGVLNQPSGVAIGAVQQPAPPPAAANGTAPPPAAANGTAPPPAAARDAPAASIDPYMILVSDRRGYNAQVFHPNGTFAYDRGYSAQLHRIAVGPDGRLVASSDYAFHVFHPNGTLAFSKGSIGRDQGEFDGAAGVNVGPDGRIIVADTGNRRVQVFHPNGTFALAIGSHASIGDPFRHPHAAALGPDGRIFVLDDGRIKAFHPNGTRDEVFGLGASFNGGSATYFGSPFAIAVGPDGNVVVTSGHGHRQIRILYPNGTVAFHAGGSGAGPGVFGDLFGLGESIAVSPDGRIIVPDYGNDRVQVFHPNGTLAFPFGELGLEPGEFHGPRAVAVIPLKPALANGTAPAPAPPANGTAPPANGTALPPVVAPPANGTALPTPPAPVICVGADLMECDLEPANGTGPPAPVTVVIEPRAPVGPLNLTAAGHAANLTIDVARLAGPGGPPLDGSAASTVTFPPAETSVAASFATVTFPPSVTAAHVPAGGRLALHVAADVPDDARVQAALAYDGSGRVELRRVVEVGAASGRVTFDVPVRILLEGQAGGRAFYIEGGADGGTITPIDQACAADDVARVHRHLGGAGECQMDSAGGDKIIYTYHLTRFGTAQPERAAPPIVHTCSVSVGAPDMHVSVRPGEYSAPARQVVANSGSAPFAHVDITATPWSDGLPASVTEVRADGAGAGYMPLAKGMPVADGLGGGQEAPLWFRLNLTSYGDTAAGTLVQTVTYQAMCDVPQPADR